MLSYSSVIASSGLFYKRAKLTLFRGTAQNTARNAGHGAELVNLLGFPQNSQKLHTELTHFIGLDTSEYLYIRTTNFLLPTPDPLPFF